MMFCICSTNTANTLRSVLVSASSMVSFCLMRLANPAQHRFRHVAAICENYALPLQRGAEVQEFASRACVRPLTSERDEIPRR